MKGTVWNESTIYHDPVTLRTIRQITTCGMVNTVPSYHTGQSFSQDGEEVIFITVRSGYSFLCKADLITGNITCLTEPVDGMGGINEAGRFGNGKGIPIGAVLAPRSKWAFYLVGRQIRAVHLDTLEEKVVVDDIPEAYFVESLAVSADEKVLIYSLDAFDRKKLGGPDAKIVRLNLDSGERKILLEKKGIAIGHLMFNPTDPDLFIFNMDKGPSFEHRVNEHSRTWIYKLSNQAITEVRTIVKQNFQTHTAWTWDGESVLYHGVLGKSEWKNNVNDAGWYIGIAGIDGIPVREYSFPNAPYYGHVSAPVKKNAVILDGNLLDGALMLLSFDEERPKVELLGRHDSDFTTMPSQYAHPHAVSDPSGRWVVFNSARRVIFTGARSDIYAMEL